MNVFNLFAKLTLDTSSYKSELESSVKLNKASTDSIKKHFSDMSSKNKIAMSNLVSDFNRGGLSVTEFNEKVDILKRNQQELDEATKNLGINTKKSSLIAKIGWAAVATAVVAIIGKIKDLALETINYADSFGDLAAKLSMSTDSVQELNYIAGQLGTNLDTLTNTMAVMYNKAKEGDDAFSKIGVSVKDANGELKSMDALFYETVGAMNAMESDSERTAAMLDVFGRSALQIGEVLNTDVDTLKAMGQEAHDLGIVISEDLTEKAGAFNDKMEEFKLRGKGILAEMLLGDGGAELDAKIDSFMDDFMNGFENIFPKFMNFVIQLLVRLAVEIVKFIPKFGPMVVKAFLSIDWLGVGLDIGKAILEGIISALGTLIGYGWLWGGDTPSTPTTDTNYSASDVVGGVVSETKTSTKVDLNINVSGETAISQQNAETIAETLLPYIDKGLGRV